MASVLTRLLGFSNLSTAEDIVQDTLLKAMTSWRFHGIPQNPSAWLYAAAKNKAIDVIRSGKYILRQQAELSNLLQSEWTLSSTVNQLFIGDEIEDSQLRMIFACCHPVIPYESQIALTLKTLCGLSAAEIANAFLTGEETISKRLYRAKEKIRAEKIELEMPPSANLSHRLDAVLHVLYLLFNEGYNSSHPNQLIREDLCGEALRLGLLLDKKPQTNGPRTKALLSLMCLQASRFNARIGDNGHIILLPKQDRQLWNSELIRKGRYYLELSAEGKEVSEYHLEAAIAYCHAEAATFADTDWKRILELYKILSTLNPGPVIEMNKAIAFGYAESAARGLQELQKIKELEHHYLYHTAMGDFNLMLNKNQEARSCYESASKLNASVQEKELLYKKIKSCG